jgi:hypothetical protein
MQPPAKEEHYSRYRDRPNDDSQNEKGRLDSKTNSFIDDPKTKAVHRTPKKVQEPNLPNKLTKGHENTQEEWPEAKPESQNYFSHPIVLPKPRASRVGLSVSGVYVDAKLIERP